MEIQHTPIEGCYLLKPTTYFDSRGHFFESFNHGKFQALTGHFTEFIQDNESTSKYGVIRGLHAQKGDFAQAKLVRVVRGKVRDVVVDARKDSPSFGEIFQIELTGNNNLQLFIPKGCLHGFSVLEDNTIFAYKCDAYYHPGSETGVNPMDDDLSIDWGIEMADAIISEKDIRQKSWLDFIGANVLDCKPVTF